MNNLKKIAITMGDPSGIGPEIILKTLNDLDEVALEKFLLIGNKAVFESEAQNIGIAIPKIEFINLDCDITHLKQGQETKESGSISFKCLEKACLMAKNKEIRAIVTAPLSKNAINTAGYKYSGQTEVLEKYMGGKAEMLFVADDFRVILLTRHIKLKDVPNYLTVKKIVETVSILGNSLNKDFKINTPKLAICGLNPHAGESGLLGKEEQEVLIPAIKELNQKGINIEGPFPADTLFVKAASSCLSNKKQPYDCYVACYHDQGLIPIKACAMDKTVNTTIGLPLLRTSPAHGTAFDIAGKNIADYSSMKEAVLLALRCS